MLRLIVFVGGIGLASYGFTKSAFAGASVLLIFISLFLVLVCAIHVMTGKRICSKIWLISTGMR